jgi:hypothetical protein
MGVNMFFNNYVDFPPAVARTPEKGVVYWFFSAGQGFFATFVSTCGHWMIGTSGNEKPSSFDTDFPDAIETQPGSISPSPAWSAA